MINLKKYTFESCLADYPVDLEGLEYVVQNGGEYPDTAFDRVCNKIIESYFSSTQTPDELYVALYHLAEIGLDVTNEDIDNLLLKVGYGTDIFPEESVDLLAKKLATARMVTHYTKNIPVNTTLLYEFLLTSQLSKNQYTILFNSSHTLEAFVNYVVMDTPKGARIKALLDCKKLPDNVYSLLFSKSSVTDAFMEYMLINTNSYDELNFLTTAQQNAIKYSRLEIKNLRPVEALNCFAFLPNTEPVKKKFKAFLTTNIRDIVFQALTKSPDLEILTQAINEQTLLYTLFAVKRPLFKNKTKEVEALYTNLHNENLSIVAAQALAEQESAEAEVLQQECNGDVQLAKDTALEETLNAIAFYTQNKNAEMLGQTIYGLIISDTEPHKLVEILQPLSLNRFIQQSLHTYIATFNDADKSTIAKLYLNPHSFIGYFVSHPGKKIAEVFYDLLDYQSCLLDFLQASDELIKDVFNHICSNCVSAEQQGLIAHAVLAVDPKLQNLNPCFATFFRGKAYGEFDYVSLFDRMDERLGAKATDLLAPMVSQLTLSSIMTPAKRANTNFSSSLFQEEKQHEQDASTNISYPSF